ncbi:MAG: hypothetical protein LBK82_03385 [Planctomycetaceae bacterium]|nr:hypothetical protein [Planctomycetaceae bacterium]
MDSIASGFNMLRSILFPLSTINFPLSTNRLPLQGDCSGGTYPPRCGGLACVALAGRRKTHNPTELMYL